MSTAGIYEIVNSVNGKRYIGSAVNVARRIKEHSSRLICGEHGNRHLQRGWLKYGKDNFTFRKLLICAPRNLLMYEQRLIDALNPEYNICKRAGSLLGHSWTDESRKKMFGNKNGIGNSGRSRILLSDNEKIILSKRMKGNKYALGRKKSKDEIAAISQRMKGNRYRLGDTPTQARKDAQRQFMLGNSYALGYRHTPETKALYSATRKGKVGALKGRPWSEARRNAQRKKSCP